MWLQVLTTWSLAIVQTRRCLIPVSSVSGNFTSDEDIFSIVGDNPTGLKLCVMADVGRCDFKNDIHKKSDSPLSLIRVATYIETFFGSYRDDRICRQARL